MVVVLIGHWADLSRVIVRQNTLGSLFGLRTWAFEHLRKVLHAVGLVLVLEIVL